MYNCQHCQSLATKLQHLEANFRESIIRHWPDFQAIASKYGCSLEIINGLRPQYAHPSLDKRDRKKSKKDIEIRHSNFARGLAIEFGVFRPKRYAHIDEPDLVATICREIAAVWQDQSIQWGGTVGDSSYFEWTATVRRYEPPPTTNRLPIPQPPALGPIPTPWRRFLALFKRQLDNPPKDQV